MKISAMFMVGLRFKVVMHVFLLLWPYVFGPVTVTVKIVGENVCSGGEEEKMNNKFYCLEIIR
jgi:hypothetical protein